MCGLSWGELLVIATVVALVLLVFRRKWLVAYGRTPWSFRRRRDRERDDPRIKVRQIDGRRLDNHGGR